MNKEAQDILNLIPEKAREAIMKESTTKIKSSVIKGYDFNNGVDYTKMFESYNACGIQATNLGLAIEQVNQMIQWRSSNEPTSTSEETKYTGIDKEARCTIFLGYTSNMISSGVREVIRYLCEHKMVDCIVTTGGGIEEDFMKCLADTYVGDFKLKGSELRDNGVNRIGNILVPNDNYCNFEDWLIPILEKLYKEQANNKTIFSPSLIIDRLGKEINNPQSVYYWCHVNNIPVFCPALTDGSLGDMLFFFTYKYSGFVIDIFSDLKRINDIAVGSKKSGMIILGGGIAKHHISRANSLRHGADYAVYINTGIEYDGSDAGASIDEAISKGEIKPECKAVKIFAEASLVFPIIVAETFAKNEKLASKL